MGTFYATMETPITIIRSSCNGNDIFTEVCSQNTYVTEQCILYKLYYRSIAAQKQLKYGIYLSMLNRVTSKLVRRCAIFALVGTVVLVIHVHVHSWTWRAPPVRSRAAVRQQNAHAPDGEQYRLPQTSFPLDARKSIYSDHFHKFDRDAYGDVLHLNRISAMTDDMSLRQTPPTDSSHLQWQKSEDTLVHVHLVQMPSSPLCTPTPHASNLMVLGKRMEKCIPSLTSQSVASKSEEFTQNDIYITIKTTQANHISRLRPLLLTWLQTVQPEQV